jgi:hypothetical protein
MKNGIVAVLVVAMLIIGFGTAFLLNPATTKTITNTYTTTSTYTSTYTSTFTPTPSGYTVNCVVYFYQVLLVMHIGNGSGATSSTGSGLLTDYTAATSLSEEAGYTTSTTTTVVDSGGPAWNSTVCTWLPK